jgi:flagellin-like hook-associated protein FlgL
MKTLEIQKHIKHIKEHIKHIIQTSEEEFEKSFNGSVAPSPNDISKLKQCILDRIKPFQDQLVKYEQLKTEPDVINLKND